MNMPARLALAAALAMLAACGQKAGDSAAVTAAADPPSPPPVAPAIISSDEVANPTEPPSYEVAIATAAANRNNALARCARQPEAVRTACQQEANAAYADAEQDLQNLRGNQE
jgi:hypothetical protein